MNPYAPPQAQPGPYAPAPPQGGWPGWNAAPAPRLHSANAIALATFLGSPLGGALLFADNERRLRRSGPAVLAVLVGLVTTALVMGLAFAVPHSSPLPLVSVFIARGIAGWREKTYPSPQGVPLTQWIAAGVGFGSLVLVLGTVVAGALVVTLVKPNKVAFPPADEVYFEDGATEEDARALGDALTRDKFFGAESGKMVTVSGTKGGLALSFVVQDGAWTSDETVHTFEDFGKQLSADAFHDPRRVVEVRLCNDWTMTKRTIALR